MKKQPTAILTDQDPWITEAISKKLPLTEHAFCIWHITLSLVVGLHLFFVINIQISA